VLYLGGAAGANNEYFLFRDQIQAQFFFPAIIFYILVFIHALVESREHAIKVRGIFLHFCYIVEDILSNILF
jgi:hypothetical protein